jgi:internalin A
MRVQRRLEALRDEDATLPVAEQKYRTLTQEHFRQICTEEGGISSPDHLLDYLHNTGLVFYRQGLFHDSIILDQGWALEAIYAVFNRDKCYRHLRYAKGRFTRSLLDVLVWQEYGRKEQKLFLSMMESCGVCFVHRKGSHDEQVETEYIAPELLPDKAVIAAELGEKWNPQQPMEEEVIEFELLHPGLLSCLVARIGASAGINGLYWRDGVCVWEKQTLSHALIEQECCDDWRGIIRVRTQGGQARLLLDRLLELIDNEQGLYGFRRRDRRHEQPQYRPESNPRQIRQEPVEECEQPKLEFAQQPKQGLEYCVSYAWGDMTKEGKEREQIVERLCLAAADRGITILRDKTVLGLGESITRFMHRIGKADRIFVVLSDKYLKSPYCMYELYEIWQYNRRDEADFLQRVRVFTLPCAKVFSLGERLDYSRYWKDEFSAVDAKIKKLGAAYIVETILKKFRLMDDFAKHVGDILETLTDIVQPRTFEELVGYGLNDSEPGA